MLPAVGAMNNSFSASIAIKALRSETIIIAATMEVIHPYLVGLSLNCSLFV